MKSDGPFRHSENLGDFPVCLAVLHPVQDGELTNRELLHTFVQNRSVPRLSPHEREMEMVSKVLDEFEVPFGFNAVHSCKRTKGGDPAGLISGGCRNAVSQTEFPGGLDKAPFLFGAGPGIGGFPMTCSRRLQCRLENRVHLVIAVLPVEAEPFIRVTYIDDVCESLKCSSRPEAGKSTEEAVE